MTDTPLKDIPPENAELETLRAWAHGPHGVRWYIDRAKTQSDRIEALEREVERLRDALDEANTALQAFKGIQPGNGWDDEIKQAAEAQATIRASLSNDLKRASLSNDLKRASLSNIEEDAG